MKIVEITNSARRLIKTMESLYISYSIGESSEAGKHLLELITKNISSTDQDVEKHARLYDQRLLEDLIRILSK